MREIAFDPNEFRCARLAGELADEWVDYVEITRISRKSGGSLGVGRSAISARRSTSMLGEHAPGAGLAKQHPDLAAVCGGVGADPSHAVSGRARRRRARCAGTVRALIAGAHTTISDPSLRVCAAWSTVPGRSALGQQPGTRRVHPHGQTRPCPRGVGMGTSAGRPPCRRMGIGRPGPPPRRARLDRQSPTCCGVWPTNRSARSKSSTNLPIVHQWPPELRACIEQLRAADLSTARAKDHPGAVAGAASSIPRHLDLHAYRVLLVAATGHTPEEVTTLTDRRCRVPCRRESG